MLTNKSPKEFRLRYENPYGEKKNYKNDDIITLDFGDDEWDFSYKIINLEEVIIAKKVTVYLRNTNDHIQLRIDLGVLNNFAHLTY